MRAASRDAVESHGLRVRFLRHWDVVTDISPSRWDAYWIGGRVRIVVSRPDQRPVLDRLFGPGPVLY